MKEGLESWNSEKIKWTVHPIKKNWKVSTGLILFLVILCISIYFSFNSLVFLLISVMFLVSSLSSFFFPTTYILQDDCITVKSIFRKFSRQWSSFNRYYQDKNGILLSPFQYPSRLENFRGLYVRLGDNRTDAIEFIRKRLEVYE